MKQPNYLFLSGLFFIVFLIVEFTDIYGNPGWFKAFVIILSASFLFGAFANRQKNNNKSEQTNK
jgi:hypothetical protein